MAPQTPRMDWTRLLNASRYGIDNQTQDVRSPFQRDVDRITFSDAFRRLARKTQVHPLNDNDHVHTRLTHSLEVATVGKSLGELAGFFLAERGELPDTVQPRDLGEIVQAACLAHDIGNPPFGHSGEEAVKSWFAGHPAHIDQIPVACQTDFTEFDGNAMAVRILLSTGFYQQGMSPTLAVIGTLLKYPWASDAGIKKGKFSFFQTEADHIASVAETLGLIDKGNRYCRHPLAYLAEAADDICYRIMDIEDATEVGILDTDFMYRSFAAALGLDGSQEQRDRYAACHFRQRNSMIRAKLIKLATTEAAELFKGRYDAIMEGSLEPTDSLMHASEGICRTIRSVYKGIEDTLFLSRRKTVLELGAHNAIGVLLDTTMAEAKNMCTGGSSAATDKIAILLNREAVEAATADPATCHYRVIMAVVDYISGMTDHYATDLCRKLLGLGY